ncbi:MAG: DMT family transporter [Prevotella sp.]|jgi:drug/metabolite transporter (DMT)-like permease
MAERHYFYHIIGIIVVLIWGTTFVNSKVLLLHGLEAHEVFTLRFLIAYICIWFISPHKLFSDNWHDELLMLVLGMTGGSLYFLSENWAVKISYVNNVSFIVCTAPLITTILAILFIKEVKATPLLIGGSLTALTGVALVIFNGRFVLRLNPAGDLLAMGASVSWAIYSLLMKKVANRYSAVFVTRKVFFYGLLTILPVYLIAPWDFPLSGLLQPAVWGNLIFLGFIASFVCFALWSLVIKKIGAMSASNYIYLNPVSTVVASAIFLDEPMTWIAYLGSALILGGVWLANK